MKTGEAAHMLGIDPKTIVNWINNPALSKYFSPTARKEDGLKQRLLTDNDVAILNTVRHASAGGRANWTEIADIVESGNLERDIPQNAGFNDTRMVPEPQARESVRAAATLAERDQLLTFVDDLKAQIAQLEKGRAEDRQTLIDMNGQLQRALLLVELYEQGRLKPKE